MNLWKWQLSASTPSSKERIRWRSPATPTSIPPTGGSSSRPWRRGYSTPVSRALGEWIWIQPDTSSPMNIAVLPLPVDQVKLSIFIFFLSRSKWYVDSSTYWLTFIQFIRFVKHWMIKEIYHPTKIRPPWSSKGVKINRLLCRSWKSVAVTVSICVDQFKYPEKFIPVYIRLE